MDLALSPNYAEDDLIFAYITTATDNRVVAFTLSGPMTAVLAGIPRGTSDNTGRIMFGSDGDLYIGTGDAGHPQDASDPSSLAGKVLRVTDIGAVPTDNPQPKSPVYTSGHRVVNGLCAQGGLILETETSAVAGTGDPVNALEPSGAYGWPPATASDAVAPVTRLPAADSGPGGCAISANGSLFVTSLNGQAVLSTTISVTSTGAVKTGKFTTLIPKKYGRLLTIVAATDGAFWITTSNRDGYGHPVPDDERVLRIKFSGASGPPQPV
jgi:glucose/arabinose dehydrogenase